MKIKNWRISILSPFKKWNNGVRIVGVQLYKDWHHSYNLDFRFNFKYPAFIICHTYTTKTEYVEKFWTFASKSYREHCGGLTWYRKYEHRQDVDEGRCGMG